jgi:hypothetical protein
MPDTKNKKSTDLVSVQPEMLSYVDKMSATELEEQDYEALVEFGRGINEVKAYSQWLLGKLGNAVSNKHGDLYIYAREINQIPQVMDQYVYTYRKYTREDPNFSPDHYFGQVPWGMLQLIASKEEKPITTLNELVDKGIRSIEGTYKEIKTKQTGKEVPHKPRIRLLFNDESSKWKLFLKPEDLDLIDWTDVKEQLMNYLQGLA